MVYNHKIGAVFLTGILLFGIVLIVIPSNVEATTYTLYEAKVNGYITTTITGSYSGYMTSFTLSNGNGVFYGKCISIEVTSTTQKTLYLEVSLKRRLISDDYDIQNMVVTNEYSFTLYAGKTKTFTIYAMCLNMHDDAPNYLCTYHLGGLASGNTAKVVSAINSKNAQDASGQCALWAATDYAKEEDLKAFGATNSQIDSAQSILEYSDTGLEVKESGLPSLGGLLIVAAVASAFVITVTINRRKYGK